MLFIYVVYMTVCVVHIVLVGVRFYQGRSLAFHNHVISWYCTEVDVM